ncbi:hypothetical protein D3C81_2167080 [compost metagenome]
MRATISKNRSCLALVEKRPTLFIVTPLSRASAITPTETPTAVQSSLVAAEALVVTAYNKRAGSILMHQGHPWVEPGFLHSAQDLN